MSAMVMVAVDGVDTSYPVPGCRVATTVSLDSADVSSVGVTVMVAVVCPAGIETVPASVV